MKKRTVVVSAFISAVFSLIFCLLTYFGYMRLFSVHMFSTESYAKSYTKLDKADDKTRVVVSLTTSNPDRLKPMLNSILDQTVQVDEIAITVPYGTNIPEYAKRVAQIYNYSVDYKDNGNLIPILMREGEKDTKIIIVNDSMIYGKDFIETMVDESKKSPGKAITVNDFNLKHGILVVPEYFKDSVLEYDGESDYDTWLHKNLNVPFKGVKYNETFRRL